MRACSMASGGVYFIPDEIEHKRVTKQTKQKIFAEKSDDGILGDKILVVKKATSPEGKLLNAA